MYSLVGVSSFIGQQVIYSSNPSGWSDVLAVNDCVTVVDQPNEVIYVLEEEPSRQWGKQPH